MLVFGLRALNTGFVTAVSWSEFDLSGDLLCSDQFGNHGAVDVR